MELGNYRSHRASLAIARTWGLILTGRGPLKGSQQRHDLTFFIERPSGCVLKRDGEETRVGAGRPSRKSLSCCSGRADAAWSGAVAGE